MKRACTICNDTGWEKIVRDNKEYLKRCRCRNSNVYIKKCRDANIPPKFIGAGLDDFYPRHTDSNIKSVIRYMNKFIGDYPAVENGVILHGNTGVGKTRLLCSVGSQIIKKFPDADVYYIDWNDMVREMKSGESHNLRDFSLINELIEKLSGVQLLLMDELGASIPSQWVRDNIYYVINHRYNRKMITLFATNYFDETSDGSPTLSERIGDRIRSRIFETAKTFRLDGFDYRQTDAKA